MDGQAANDDVSLKTLSLQKKSNSQRVEMAFVRTYQSCIGRFRTYGAVFLVIICIFIKKGSLVKKDLKGKLSPSRLKPSKTKMSMYEMEIYTELKCEKILYSFRLVRFSPLLYFFHTFIFYIFPSRAFTS